MLFISRVKQIANEKLAELCLSCETVLSESIQQLQGTQSLAMKPIRMSEQGRRSLRR
jgi:hypothetical protein